MCNIAAYVGNRPAAPILIEMMRREEALNGGHYTGIATIHEGKLYYAKLVGDLDRLLEKTNAAALPGTIGFIHSRTPSNDGDEWAHPFIGCRGAEERIAYICNGSTGFFRSLHLPYTQMAEELLAAGYTMRSRTKLDKTVYTTLSDGTMVHGSDVMCQLIQYNIDHGDDEETALANAYLKRPSELVGLVLSIEHPDRIFWSRVNMPMFVGQAPHGTYMASAAMVFPDDAGEPALLPPLSSGVVCAGSFTARPYPKELCKVAGINARVIHDAYDVVLSALQEGKKTYPDLIPLVKPLFEKADCLPTAAVIYEVLRALSREGKLRSEIVRVPGSAEGLTAPVFDLCAADGVGRTVSAPDHSK